LNWSIRFASLLCLAAFSSGCHDVPSIECGELTCSTELACTPLEDACVRPELIEACKSREEGAECAAAGGEQNVCRQGVCSPRICGDGLLEPGEVCDDGNRDDDDGCSSDCLSDETCGNGVVDTATDEGCDDGNQVAGDGCSPECTEEQCGDGVLDSAAGEVCDDGNLENGDGCSRDCQSREVCGNGIIDDARLETCDDGNDAPGDGCSEECKVEGCGNGLVEELRGEVCDDGNDVSGDGCRADCRKEEICGDGIIDEQEDCDDANSNSGDSCAECRFVSWNTSVLIGAENQATDSLLFSPNGIAMDRQENVYIADTDNHRIRRFSLRTGVIETMAGTGREGDSSDGTLATLAALDAPTGVAVDLDGNVLFAEHDRNRILRINADTDRLEVVAGVGLDAGRINSGHPATASEIYSPEAIALDGLGNLFICQDDEARVVVVDERTQRLRELVDGGFGNLGDGGPALDAELESPEDIAVDAWGNVFIADAYNYRVRYIDAATGHMEPLAGTGVIGFAGDGGPALAAELNQPRGLDVDQAGNVYIADTLNHRVRRVDRLTGVITTIAGTGVAGALGDDGSPTQAQLNFPDDVAVDELGNIVISDRGNHSIRWIDPSTDTIHTVAGTPGKPGRDSQISPRTLAYTTIIGLEVDSEGRLYVSDSNPDHIVRTRTDGFLEVIAGTGKSGFSEDGMAALATPIANPNNMALLPNGDIVFGVSTNKILRLDASSGTISTLAGTAVAGYSGDGAAATEAEIDDPIGIAVAPNGDIYFSDNDNDVVRRIDAISGFIEHVAGTGDDDFNGDDMLATVAALDSPQGLAFDSLGHLYIADSSNDRVRRVDAVTGLISTVAGNGSNDYSGDGGLAVEAGVDRPYDIAFDSTGRLVIASNADHSVRRVDMTNGIISTIAGTGVSGNSGDGGLATVAQFDNPVRLAVGPDDTVFIADTNDRVRAIDPTTGVITTVSGLISPVPTGDTADPDVRLAAPAAITRGGGYLWIAGGSFGLVQTLAEDGTLKNVAGRYPESVRRSGSAFGTELFGEVHGIAYDEKRGVVYFTESSVVHPYEDTAEHAPHDFQRVWVLDPVDPEDPSSWTIEVLAGDLFGYADGDGSVARFGGPSGLLLEDDILYVADAGVHAIRSIDLSGGLNAVSVSTPYGTPLMVGFDGDGAEANLALLNAPTALARCANGDLFFADTGNRRVRRIESNGEVSTVLGTGGTESNTEGAPSSQYAITTPLGLSCDRYGNLFLSSRGSIRSLVADDQGVVDGTGAVEIIYGREPHVSFPQNQTSCLGAVYLDDEDRLLVADRCDGILVQLDRAIQ